MTVRQCASWAILWILASILWILASILDWNAITASVLVIALGALTGLILSIWLIVGD